MFSNRIVGCALDVRMTAGQLATSLHTSAAVLNGQGIITATGQRWVGVTVGKALAQK